MTDEETRIIPTTGRNNCGGRCLLYAHMRGEEILRMTTQREDDCPGEVPLTACARGLNYHKTYLSEQRLRYPMLRVGERGEGEFVRISWAEAVERIASEWIRIRDTYGPGSRYVNYSTGVSAVFRPDKLAKRLLRLDGGHLDYYNSYSTACISHATQLMYGTEATGSSPDNWLQSRLILLWGHNPAETVFDSQTMYYLRRARSQGTPIIVIDPRKSATVRELDAEWIPIRPATDSALADAMAYVIWQEGLADQAFLDRCCLGFDREHMPTGFEAEESVLEYLKGTRDGTPKTPAWAEQITGVPAGVIRDLAVRYAAAKPAALVQGYGAQRHAYGEQSARGAILLACMSGNVGVTGGGAAGTGYYARHRKPSMPIPENPYPMRIPVFSWTDAIDHGTEMTAPDGVTGGERLESNIRMLLNLAGNTLINQHSDINRTAALLRDTKKCEFIVCSDLFMTPSARFADILLPGISMLECENLTVPWHWGDFVGFCNKIAEPIGEGRFEYEWLSEVAEKLGLGEQFTEGRSHSEWLRFLYEQTRESEPELPDYETLKQNGIARFHDKGSFVGFAAARACPEAFPFPTESGKVELFSPRAARTQFREPFPAIPRYVAPPEGAQDPLRERYPLQLIGWHIWNRCHSIHDNYPVLARGEPQRLWMHPKDAQARALREGETAQVFNDRGALRIPVHLTEDIMPGVCALAQGAWYAPEGDGTDIGGSINVLTSQRPTPLAHGNPQHTNLVEVRQSTY